MGGGMNAQPAVVFTDQLPGKRPSPPRPEVQAFADQLRANPRRWAEYPWWMPERQARSRASDITHGRRTAPVALRQGFEGASRAGTIYVRYIGEPS